MPSSAIQWWRRASAKAKDQTSICLAHVAGRSELCNPHIEAAVIRATSHDDTSLDYKNVRRVFRWAPSSPSSHLHPLMWSLASRASRTRSWPVALKCLLLAHGLLLASSGAGRLPFDLSDFRARSPSSRGFSAFVRAYFNFLDNRSIFLARHGRDDSPDDEDLHRVENLQSLLDLLMQIRPYADGMEVGLILEAMGCAMLEIFEVYSGICNGIACFLVGYMSRRHGGGGNFTAAAGGLKSGKQEERRQRGLQGIKVLKRAAEQSDRLSAYFDLCRRLGVMNAAELPRVEKIPDEDILDLEKLVMGYGYAQVEQTEKKRLKAAAPPATVVTEDWVVFEEKETVLRNGLSVNPFDDDGCQQQQQQQQSWALMVHHSNAPIGFSGDLIEL